MYVCMYRFHVCLNTCGRAVYIFYCKPNTNSHLGSIQFCFVQVVIISSCNYSCNCYSCKF